MHGGSFDPSPHPLNQCAIRHSARMQPRRSTSRAESWQQQECSEKAAAKQQSDSSSRHPFSFSRRTWKVASNSGYSYTPGLKRGEKALQNSRQTCEAESPKVMRGGLAMCGHAKRMPAVYCYSVLSSTAATTQAQH